MAFIAGKALEGTGLAGYLVSRLKAKLGAAFSLKGGAPYIDAEADAIVSYIDDEYGGGGGTPTLAAVLTAGNSAGTKKITNLVDPTAAQDAATKNYVDSATPATPGLSAVVAVNANANATRITNVGSATTAGDALAYNQAAAKVASLAVGDATALATDCVFQVSGTDRTSNPWPRMTTTQRLALGTPAVGQVVFDTTLQCVMVYTTSGWRAFSATAVTGGAAGPIASLPAATAVAPGTVYRPTDDPYEYCSDGAQWLIRAAHCPWMEAAGDLSAWTYDSPTPGYAQLVNRYGYTRCNALAQNPSPEYIDWLSASPSIVAGPSGEWTITAVFRWMGFSTGGNTYANIGIMLLDEATHRFLAGPMLNGNYNYTAHACGFTGATRNYYSSLSVADGSIVNPMNGIFKVRLRKTAAGLYIYQYTDNMIDWTTTVAGGTNVFLYAGGNAITPTRWGIGMQYIPHISGKWDILYVKQTATDEGA